MPSKNKKLIYRIIRKHESASVTSLMKLAYLIDLVSVKRTGEKISEFDYFRYTYGPFNPAIYGVLEELSSEGKVSSQSVFSGVGEYIVYTAVDTDSEEFVEGLAPDEQSLVDEVVLSLQGYGAKALTEIAYKTEPMCALGATLGGAEAIGARLELSSVRKN